MELTPQTTSKKAPEDQPAQAQPRIKVNFGGATFGFEPGASPEFIQEFFLNFRKTDKFDRLIDKKRGSPATVRAVVDELDNQEDKLATLKNYYPDAAFYGEDNFIYTDPETGKFTLHNPIGLDAGDFAGYARTASEAFFGTAAGFGAFAAGQMGPQAFLPEEAITVPLAVAAGTEFGARAFDLTTQIFGRRVRTPKGVGGELLESGVRMGTAATGEVAGPLIAKGLKKVISGPTGAAAALAQKFRELGIDPVASAISEGTLLARVEKGLEVAGTSANIIEEQTRRVVGQTSDALDKIASKIGTVLDRTSAGEAMKEAAKKSKDAARTWFSAQYDNIFHDIGADALVTNMDNVKDAIAPRLAELADFPAAAAPKGQLKDLIKKYEAITSMAENGQLTFEQFRRFRTDLLAIQRKKVSGTTGDYDRLVDDLSDAMRKDMTNAASDVSPDASRALAALDKEYAAFKEGADKTLKKIMDYDADTAAFEYLLTSAKSKGPEGVKALERLRSHFTKEEWGDVAASVLYDLGRETAGRQVGQTAEFSVATFMTRLSEIRKAGPEAVEALFGGTGQEETMRELMKFVDVVGALKEVNRVANVSQTAGGIGQLLIWQTLGTASTGMMVGDVTGAATAVSGSLLAPWVGAKMLTNPSVVKWLATPAKKIGEMGMAAHLGRLSAIAIAEPMMQDVIGQFFDALRPAVGYSGNQGAAKQ